MSTEPPAPAGTAAAPLRAAIVGSGPAGFFAAAELLGTKRPVAVDLIEQNWAPFGLVRYGVSPDHGHTRRVIKLFEQTLAHPAVRLLANVRLGRDLSVDELRRHYDAIVLATGAEEDRELRIPGEHLPGCHASLEFAAWVNGHPAFADASFDFAADTAVVLGNGNVALDVVRLLCDTPERLRATDISDAALAALAASKVRTIHVIGRRGPVQASFGENEITELAGLADIAFRVDPAALVLSETDRAELEGPDGDRRRIIVDTLRDLASRPPPSAPRRIVHFDFLRAPAAVIGTDRVEAIDLRACRLQGDAGEQAAIADGEVRRLPCGLVIKAIGHTGTPLASLPFDGTKGVVPTRRHRVVADGAPVPGFYAVGWIKRGAKGLIGHNRRDAMETVAAILEDLPSLPRCAEPDPAAVSALLAARGVRAIGKQDWARIDAEELRRGAAAGRARANLLRLTDVEALLASSP